ncbi:MAG: hypothetical protein ACOYEB_12025 [Enterococcus lemanii]|jgi:hypothetical protein
MATYNKFQCFVEDICEKKHDLGSDTLKVAFSNASNAPSASADAVLADISTIATTNLDSVTLTVSSSSQTTGTYKLVVADKTLTATGDVPAFRYVIVYNDTAANDELICFFDYGSEVTLASGDTFKLDFGTELFSLA